MKHLFIILFTGFFVQNSISQDVDLKPQNSVQSKADELMGFKTLKNSAFSFYVKDMNSGAVVADYNANMSIPSASTMKLVSTATALQLVGSGYRFKTRIMYSGEIDSSGTLNGDLYLVGGGDPTLGSKYFNKEGHQSDFLQEWADTLKAIGLLKVNGRVIADGSVYSYQGAPSGWIWGDMGNYYGAGPAGLTIFDNLCIYHFETGPNSGDSTKLTCTTPYIPGINIRNYVIAADSKKDNAYVYGAPWSTDWFVRGSIPKGEDDFQVKASIPDPELVAGIELDFILEQNGIDILYAPQTMRELTLESPFKKPELKLLYEHSSPSLLSVINITNRSSINLFAEHILCQISVKRAGYGSTYNGALACEKYWAGKIGGGGLNMTDGSGLSRSNSVSAKFLVDMLTFMHKQNTGSSLKNSMAVAGKSGTMSSMCRGTAAAGRVYGKSGTMTRIKSYAGYVDSKSGKKLSYAMIINNHTCSNTQIKKYFEALMVKMATY